MVKTSAAKSRSPSEDVEIVSEKPGVARTMAAADVAEDLRHRIQNNELPVGEWLREARICSEFGVGRSIARRALRTLADDGLVELEENRGARVTTTSVEEVFDLYEVRAALYGLAARFTCLRASDEDIAALVQEIDGLLAAAEKAVPAEQIIEISEHIFTAMASHSSPDAQKMIASIRRKTRFHFSYVALALNAKGEGPYPHWRRCRAGLDQRDADAASEAAREVLYFMQGEVSRIMLAHRSRRR